MSTKTTQNESFVVQQGITNPRDGEITWMNQSQWSQRADAMKEYRRLKRQHKINRWRVLRTVIEVLARHVPGEIEE